MFTKGNLSLLNNQNILSSEAYLMDDFEDIYESQILEQLLKFNYIGLSFGYSTVHNEFIKYLSGENNLYEKCLSNLSPMKTLNTRMVVDSILLVRIIYTQVSDWEKKKQEAQKIFNAVLEEVSKEDFLVVGFLLLINQQFSLFSIKWIDSVKEDFLTAFKLS